MGNKIVWIGLVIWSGIVAAGINTWAEEKKVRIIYATSGSPGDFHVVYAEKFKALSERYSGGKLQIDLHVGGILGTEQKNLMDTAEGEIHMCTLAVNNVTPFVPALGVLTLPYIFPTKETAYKLFTHPIMEDFNQEMTKMANIRALGWLIGGYRVLTNSQKEVARPGDLNGLKIRVPENPIMVAVFRAWGIEPVALAWSEVANALQTGLVDGQENPYPVIVSNKFYTSQKYLTNIHYLLWTGPHIVNENFYQRISKDLKQVIGKASQEAQKYSWKWVEEESVKNIMLLKKKGMRIIEPANEQEWMRQARSIWSRFYDQVGGKEFVEKIAAILEN